MNKIYRAEPNNNYTSWRVLDPRGRVVIGGLSELDAKSLAHGFTNHPSDWPNL